MIGFGTDPARVGLIQVLGLAMKIIGYSIAAIGFALMAYAFHIQNVLLQPGRQFPSPEAGQIYRIDLKGSDVYADRREFWAHEASFGVGCILFLCGGAIAQKRRSNAAGGDA